jgi:Protein of unknown function (DUF2924)
VRQRSIDSAAIEAEINRIWSLGLDALRRHWQAAFGRTPPCGLSKDIMARMIAGRMQERAFGGLDHASVTLLDGLARHNRPARRHLKVGTVLVRDYQGQRHTVTIVHDGFLWQGTTYRSLSAIARAITGTAWSGPRFFGFKEADDRQQAKHRMTAAPPPGDRGLGAGNPQPRRSRTMQRPSKRQRPMRSPSTSSTARPVTLIPHDSATATRRP